MYLTEAQLNAKVADLNVYLRPRKGACAADLSKYDANANVDQVNVAVLEADANKDVNIQVNRKFMTNKISKLFGPGLALEYLDDLKNHLIYTHDESSLKPYCASVSLFPMLLEGMAGLGGESKAPRNLHSFCGIFINLVFALSSQFAGAIATVEFLMYFDKFARAQYGDNYLEDNKELVDSCFQQVVYSLNQPAAARGYQAVFWNISLFDEHFFSSLFGDFMFPDGVKPNWEGTEILQEYFMNWFNKERETAVLTFPVVTAAMLTKDRDVVDTKFADMCSNQLAAGNSFFMYLSDSVDSLASCCRLRNEMVDNTFSYTLGAGGVSTGSINVMTINMNRLVQTGEALEHLVDRIHLYQEAYRDVVQDYYDADLLPAYSSGFITLDKQYLTIGINGMVEAAEYYGIKADYNPEYVEFVDSQLSIIFEMNKRAKKPGLMFNTEFVPAENLGVKSAKWDKADGFEVPRDCYNSYFYPVEADMSILEKMKLHGREMIQNLDGGSALHLNLEEYLTADGYRQLIRCAAEAGCNYLCTNTKVTVCNSCGYINKETKLHCTKCNSQEVDHATRVIGFLKRISSFSAGRKVEAGLRFYHNE